jgi:peptide/nickel transport system substrate-binding protein
VKKLAAQMATYNPTAAKKTLTDAGFTYKGDTLLDPKGNPVQLNIHVISGWSDWVASNQIITKNLRDIGIDSQVKLEASWGDWFPNAFSTKNPTLLWQVASRGSPYGYFYANLHPNAFIPSGQDGTPDGQLGALRQPEGAAAPEPVEGDARDCEAEAAGNAASRSSGSRPCRSSR